jgi:hypothetical protein
MEEINSNFIKIIKDIIKLFDIEIDNTNNSNTCIAFCIYVMSNFKKKLILDNSTLIEHNININMSDSINEFLINANSKFLITSTMNDDEFAHFIYYILFEYDIVQDYIQYIEKTNKKYVLVSVGNIFDINLEENLSEYETMSFLQNFNKMNYNIKNIKRQMDLFINNSFKLNEIRNKQDKPLK